MNDQEMLRLTGARILRERTNRGWTCRDLAAKAGLSVATVSRAERGSANMWITCAVKLATTLGVSLDALTAPAACGTCDGVPPPGFTCNGCGTRGKTEGGP